MHSLFEMGKQERVLFGYIGDLLDATIPIIDDIQLGVLGLDWKVEEVTQDREKWADDFWRAVLKGMKYRQG